ncbi:hypothetical protein L226DRAFT_617470 [Lentinus tigrinus ALCF2SS1-7]|uniref:DUF5648 domain-containing protein n=1 Tax=Lentinus tigrinus ALCF2SS1-6 TaxID=1328759 RepID=A0A5C2RR38_9APHY|nr:hypothetical protein L227DRAFT_567983 [Lentinus tigrinus ALCF2SS1-6]RPD68603.1 hypothetical protein L226DRAFT_617470 [Lentinus tigrinus ALCF2SS1-7]
MKTILSALATAALVLQARSFPSPGPSAIEARAAEACGFPTIPLYRVVSDSISDRIFTTDASEVEHALESGVYVRQAVLAYIYSNTTGPNVPNAVPYYRLGSAAKTDHFITTSWDEVESAVATNGYEYEGTVGYVYADTSAETGCPGTVGFWRTFDPQLEDHFYTTNASEANAVASNGYLNQGISAYVFPA